MKLLACETVSAIVHHLRVDDGNHKPSGGANMDLRLCCKGKATPPGAYKEMGWDIPRCPIPASPDDARKQNERLPLGQRWCNACLAAWDEALVQDAMAAAMASYPGDPLPAEFDMGLKWFKEKTMADFEARHVKKA